MIHQWADGLGVYIILGQNKPICVSRPGPMPFLGWWFQLTHWPRLLFIASRLVRTIDQSFLKGLGAKRLGDDGVTSPKTSQFLTYPNHPKSRMWRYCPTPKALSPWQGLSHRNQPPSPSRKMSPSGSGISESPGGKLGTKGYTWDIPGMHLEMFHEPMAWLLCLDSKSANEGIWTYADLRCCFLTFFLAGQDFATLSVKFLKHLQWNV